MASFALRFDRLDLHSEGESHRPEDVPDLVQGLPAEVLGLEHVLFRLLDEVPDGPDAGVLQAVGAAHRELELVNGSIQVFGEVLGELAVSAAIERRLMLDVDEDREVVAQEGRREPDRVRGRDRAVGPDFQNQAVIVGRLPDARRLDVVVYPPHRRVNRVDGNVADTHVLVEVLVGRHVAAAHGDPQLHLELPVLGKSRDGRRRIEDLDRGVSGQIGRRNLSLLLRVEGQDLLVGRVHLDGNLLQIQDDVRHVLDNTGERRELVQHAFDLHGRDRRSFDRGEQNASQRVPDRRSEPALERLRVELAIRPRQRLAVDLEPFRFLKSLPERHFFLPPSALYLEYSSTISCSAIGSLMSSRFGSSDTRPEKLSGDRSSQPGTPRARAVSTEALICSFTRLFSLIATTSPFATLKEGIVTFLPLIVTCPWRTS